MIIASDYAWDENGRLRIEGGDFVRAGSIPVPLNDGRTVITNECDAKHIEGTLLAAKEVYRFSPMDRRECPK